LLVRADLRSSSFAPWARYSKVRSRPYRPLYRQSSGSLWWCRSARLSLAPAGAAGLRYRRAVSDRVVLHPLPGDSALLGFLEREPLPASVFTEAVLGKDKERAVVAMTAAPDRAVEGEGLRRDMLLPPFEDEESSLSPLLPAFAGPYVDLLHLRRIPRRAPQSWSFHGPFGPLRPGSIAATLQIIAMSAPIVTACLWCRSVILPTRQDPACLSPVEAIAAEYQIKTVQTRRARCRAAGPALRPFSPPFANEQQARLNL